MPILWITLLLLPLLAGGTLAAMMLLGRPGSPPKSVPAPKQRPRPRVAEAPLATPAPAAEPSPNDLLVVDPSRWSAPPPGSRARLPHEYTKRHTDRVQGEIERATSKLGARIRITRGLATSWREPKELVELVSGDPVLAGRVLRTINSGYYGLRQRVGSISHAVLLLGTNEVRNIVLNASVAGSFSLGNVPPSLSHALWRHAFASSRAAYLLGKRFGYPRPDELATAALMHDIGKLLFLSIDPGKALAIYSPARFSTHGMLDREEVAFGIHHAAVGGLLAKTFGLPDRECAAIGSHHAPAYGPPEGRREEHRSVAMLYAVSLLGHLAERTPEGEDVPEVYPPAAGWLDEIAPGATLEGLCDEPTRRALFSSWNLAA
jgi:HD-like signal output (HDOD) protein